MSAEKACPECIDKTVRNVIKAIGTSVVACKGPNCRADIFYLTTASGKATPFDVVTGEVHFPHCVDRHRFRRVRELKKRKDERRKKEDAARNE